MKLSVSNIAWDNREMDEHLRLLKELGCRGVEIAPSLIWNDPADVTWAQARAFREQMGAFGLEIPALHALLFTKPGLYLFGDEAGRRDMIDYLKKLVRLAGGLSANVLVYGSPKSRLVGDKSYGWCYDTAVRAFSDIADEAAINGVFFCIEPLGPSESDFINSADEGMKIVRDVGKSNFGLHLDIKAMFDQNEDFERVFRLYSKDVRHIHVGDPGLAPPGHTGVEHMQAGKAISGSSYNGYLSIEMKRGFGDSRDVIKRSIEYVRSRYMA